MHKRNANCEAKRRFAEINQEIDPTELNLPAQYSGESACREDRKNGKHGTHLANRGAPDQCS